MAYLKGLTRPTIIGNHLLWEHLLALYASGPLVVSNSSPRTHTDTLRTLEHFYFPAKFLNEPITFVFQLLLLQLGARNNKLLSGK